MNHYSTIKKLQQLGKKIVITITGGGGQIIGELLRYGGSSSTILECNVPYSTNAVDSLLGYTPSKYCSEETARKLALESYRRAARLSKDPMNSVGVAVTASLSKENQREGRANVAHIGIQTAYQTFSDSSEFKDTKGRIEQEDELTKEVINLLPECINVLCQKKYPDIYTEALANDKCVWVPINSNRPSVFLFPGSFNPIHAGHTAIIDYAASSIDNQSKFVDLEISMTNADKAPLDMSDIVKRIKPIKNIKNIGGVWLTNTPKFTDKTLFFEDKIFLLGMDTFVRIFEHKYYDDYNNQLGDIAAHMNLNNHRIWAFERVSETKKGISIPIDADIYLQGRYNVVKDFIPVDISSAELRASE